MRDSTNTELYFFRVAVLDKVTDFLLFLGKLLIVGLVGECLSSVLFTLDSNFAFTLGSTNMHADCIAFSLTSPNQSSLILVKVPDARKDNDTLLEVGVLNLLVSCSKGSLPFSSSLGE